LRKEGYHQQAGQIASTSFYGTLAIEHRCHRDSRIHVAPADIVHGVHNGTQSSTSSPRGGVGMLGEAYSNLVVVKPPHTKNLIGDPHPNYG